MTFDQAILQRISNRKYLDAILQSVNQGHALFKVEQGEVQPLENWE